MKDNDKSSMTIKIAPDHRRTTEAALVRCHGLQDARGSLKQTKSFGCQLLHSAMYALRTASSLSLLSSCAQLQPSRPPKVVSKPSPKPKLVLYQWQGNGHKVSRIEVDLDKQKAFFYAGPDKIGWARVAAGGKIQDHRKGREEAFEPLRKDL